MIPVWYDAAHPAIYVGAMQQVFPPQTLVALLNADTTIEIWIVGQVSRVVGPVPFGWITDSTGNVFASEILTKAYLDGEFGKTPITANVAPFVFSSPASVWTIAHNLGRNPSVQLLTPGGVEMQGQIVHLSTNVAQALFDGAYAGFATIT